MRQINRAYSKDAEQLENLMTSRWEKNVIPPNLDGLFGGKACFRKWIDKSKRKVNVQKLFQLLGIIQPTNNENF